METNEEITVDSIFEDDDAATGSDDGTVGTQPPVDITNGIIPPVEVPDPAPDPAPIDGQPGEAPIPPETDTDAGTGIEQLLADYGVEGGMITFQDGEKVHVNDLTPREQYAALRAVIDNERPVIEKELDLADDEIELLYGRYRFIKK